MFEELFSNLSNFLTWSQVAFCIWMAWHVLFAALCWFIGVYFLEFPFISYSAFVPANESLNCVSVICFVIR